MRILIVSQYFWPENFRINEIVVSLVERGVDVDVLTSKPNYPEGKIYAGYRAWGFQVESWRGACVYRIPIFPRGNGGGVHLTLNYLSFVISGLLSAPWVLRKKKYDVIFVYGLSPIMMAIPAVFINWIKKARLYIWVQDLWPDSLSATGYINNKLILGAVRYVVTLIYRSSTLLLVQSKSFIEPVSSMAKSTPVIYFPNSVDALFYRHTHSSHDDAELKIFDNVFSIVFAGNIGKAQAVEVIVKAAILLKEYTDIRFVILGKGSRWDWMKKQAEVENLTNLYLLGRFPVDMMPSFMRKANVMLVTLANEHIFSLTVPNKVQAYLAVGRPIVACLNGEGARIIKDSQSGYCAPAEDEKALAEAIIKLYKMPPDLRERLGSNGKQYFLEHFEHDTLMDQLVAHLENDSYI